MPEPPSGNAAVKLSEASPVKQALALQSALDAAREMQQMLDKLCEQSFWLKEQLDVAVTAATITPQAAQADAFSTPEVPSPKSHVLPEIARSSFQSCVLEACSTRAGSCNKNGKPSTVRSEGANLLDEDKVVHCSTELPMAGSLTSMCLTHPRSLLPPDKRYHYFLSHKKHHSRLADASEHVARSLHDSLTALGFIGFFDIDSLAIINKETLEKAVSESCVMLVVMSDETVQSEWCRFEWTVAEANNIEMKCLVDIQRFRKQDVLMSASSHAALLKNQWFDYSDQLRRSCFDQVNRWLSASLQAEAPKATPVKREIYEAAMHPAFKCLSWLAGSSVGFHGNTCYSMRHIWVWFSRTVTVWFLAANIATFFASHGPAGSVSVWMPFLACIHLVVTYLSTITSVWLTDATQDMLEGFANSPGAEIVLRRLRRATCIAGLVGFPSAMALTAGVVRVFRHGDLSSSTGSAPTHVFFSFSRFAGFVVVAPITLLQVWEFLTLLHILGEIGVGIFETAFDNLDQKISLIGIRGFVGAGHTAIMPQLAAVDFFRCAWVDAHMLMCRVQRKASRALTIHYIAHGCGVMIPLVVQYFDNPWRKGGRVEESILIVGWWLIAVVVYSLAVIVPFVAGQRMSKLRDVGRSLTFPVPEDQLRSDSLMGIDLSWRFGPCNLGGFMVTVMLAPVICSIFFFLSLVHGATQHA
eukprot:TRINITY_DN54896_c0_g1_i1.p1 TRINITY_DN54896_c0_g1~~TRINITY_DN54896_c0_g1_i1.p1  ORF type:complete len:724 (-),score=78.38 TRINITY_DN54896_c0_g1_i1:51-2141(-)